MKYPIRIMVLNMDSPYDNHEFMSIHLMAHPSVAEPEYNGIDICLPYVHDPAQAKVLWEELAKVMTALEAYIGRNSD